VGGRPGVPAPLVRDETTPADNRLMLDAAVLSSSGVVGKGPRVAIKADQAGGVAAARLLPVAKSRMPMGLTRERFACSWLTRPPVIRGFASASPCQTDVRLTCSELVDLLYFLPC
jgi:hypothetical protein